MSVGSIQLPAPAALTRQWSALVGLVASSALLVGTAVWIEWGRFGLGTPSLIDDWYSIPYGEKAFHALASGHYGSASVDFVGRYRPTYAGVWNYAQWHLLGDPSVGIAAAWGLVRIIFFLAAVWLLAAMLIGRPRSGRPPLWLAPLAVALTPAIAIDLARYSPAEPLMVAGLVFGLFLAGIGLRSVAGRGVFTPQAAALIAAGYALYLFGIYFKETSIGLLVLVPFVVKAYGRSGFDLIRRSRRDACLIGCSAFLLIAPLVHLSVRLWLSLGDSRVASTYTHASPARRFLSAFVLPLIGAPGLLGTFIWLVATPVAITVAVLAVRDRGAEGWLLMGVLAAGFAMSGLSLARDSGSRYLIPWIVAVAAVGIRALADTPAVLPVCVLVIVLAVGASETRPELGRWLASERSGAAAIDFAEGTVQAHCRLYLSNFDVERRVAIPRLLSFGQPYPIKPCAGGHDAYVLSWQAAALPAEFANRCRTSWVRIASRNQVTAYFCRSMTGTRLIDQDAASGQPGIRVVRVRVPTRDVGPADLFLGLTHRTP